MTREFVYFTRFNRTEHEKPLHDKIIDDYRTFYRSRITGLGELQDYPVARVASCGEYHLREDRDGWPPLSFGMPGKCCLDIWPALFELSFDNLLEEVADIVFGAAQLGGLCVWLPKTILIIDATQRHQLPVSWDEQINVVECQNAKSLYNLIKKYKLDVPQSKRDYQSLPYGPLTTGTVPRRGRAIYIEAIQKETVVQHQRKVYKH
ncbi:MAG: hypothetical protein ACRCZF_17955, partial [Gemmataceae bacterium]